MAKKSKGYTGRNSEGYRDPTSSKAISNIAREERLCEIERLAAMSKIIETIKKMANLVGFEVVGRIVLKDKRTGKEYK